MARSTVLKFHFVTWLTLGLVLSLVLVVVARAHCGQAMDPRRASWWRGWRTSTP